MVRVRDRMAVEDGNQLIGILSETDRRADEERLPSSSSTRGDQPNTDPSRIALSPAHGTVARDLRLYSPQTGRKEVFR
jgi:hypothetical protein